MVLHASGKRLKRDWRPTRPATIVALAVALLVVLVSNPRPTISSGTYGWSDTLVQIHGSDKISLLSRTPENTEYVELDWIEIVVKEQRKSLLGVPVAKVTSWSFGRPSGIVPPEARPIVHSEIKRRLPDAVFGSDQVTSGSHRVILWQSFLPELGHLLVVAGFLVGVCWLAAEYRIKMIWSSRMRHGRCVGCGYDLGSMTTCPECGRSEQARGS